MTAAEIAKEFAGYIGSDDPEWVAKLGNRLQERVEALVAGEVNEAKASVQRLAEVMKMFAKHGIMFVEERHEKASAALASIPAHLLAKEEVKP